MHVPILNTTNTSLPYHSPALHQALQNSGFLVEPAKVEKLACQASVDVTVVLLAREGVKLGRKNTILPIEVKGGGATVHLILSANICMPEVTLLLCLSLLYLPF